VEELVSEINDSFGKPGWKPIVAFYDNNYTQAMAAMKFYDVLLVNPIMDGMNLVSKEGPIVNTKSGVLILSETAGSYDQLKDGVLPVSAADIEGTYRALCQALELPHEKRKEFEEMLRDNIAREDVIDWVQKLFFDLNHNLE
jgi:trehalose 6-phosphate synthase